MKSLLRTIIEYLRSRRSEPTATSVTQKQIEPTLVEPPTTTPAVLDTDHFSENEIDGQLVALVIGTPIVEVVPSPIKEVSKVEDIEINEIVAASPVAKKPIITEAQFIKLFPTGRKDLVPFLNNFMDIGNITTELRASHFLAQCAQESGGFRVVTENLNYSKEGLLKIFKKYFLTDAEAAKYARKPDDIANKVYANRMANGNSLSGDGFRFRGRGLIQLTGRANYTAYAADRKITVPEAVDFCTRGGGIVDSAVWFWTKNNCNTIADTGNITLLTKRINGGSHGLDGRRAYFESIRKVIASNFK